MQRGILAIGLAAASGILSAPAFAEWRCDCTTILDSCAASVAVEETFIEVTAQAAQCARVDYFIDGMPFVSLAVDGSAREDWITRSENPRVLVQSCQVCRDNAADASAETAAAAAAPTAATAATAELRPLVAAQPAYPMQARERGLEGSVTVAFTINPYGDTQDVRVVSAQPPGVFDLAAVSAVSRWRYPADGEREPVSRSETLEFRIDDFIFSDLTAPAPQAPQAARPGNQCVRENISYNYGEMIEVGLINACAQPITLFACASGTGALTQRWVCSSTDDNATVLVRPGDSRQGYKMAMPTQTGVRDFEYAQSFFVARAPNTEYWWIACGSDDATCRNAARQWMDSVDRQGAQVDPQLRTRLEVARSF